MRWHGGARFACLTLLVTIMWLCLCAAPSTGQETREGVTAAVRGRQGRTFSNDPLDYVDISVRWWWLPLAGLVLLRCTRFLRHRVVGRGLACHATAALTWVGLLAVLALLLTRASSSGRYIFDPVLIWRHAPNLGKKGGAVDKDGLRPGPPGVDPARVIIMLGGSAMFGLHVNSDEIFSWQLCKIINEVQLRRCPRIVNLACPGYTSWQGRKLLARTLRTVSPQLVVVAFMDDDWTKSVVPDRDVRATDEASDRGWSAFENSALVLAWSELVRWIHGRDDMHTARSERSVRVSPTDFEDNLEAMRRLCVAHRVPVLFLTLPLAPDVDDISRPYREATEKVGARPGALYLDLKTRWHEQGVDDFVPGMPTLVNAAGHRRIAVDLAAFLSRNGLLP